MSESIFQGIENKVFRKVWEKAKVGQEVGRSQIKKGSHSDGSH
jgi:hypothetical protein